MQSELHRKNVYHSVHLLLLVPMLFLLPISKCLLILKENSHYSSLHGDDEMGQDCTSISIKRSPKWLSANSSGER